MIILLIKLTLTLAKLNDDLTSININDCFTIESITNRDANFTNYIGSKICKERKEVYHQTIFEFESS